MENAFSPDDSFDKQNTYRLPGVQVSWINEVFIARHSPVGDYNELGSEPLSISGIRLNEAAFTGRDNGTSVDTLIVQQATGMVLKCPCRQPKEKLCSHMSSALLQVITNPNYRPFFDDTLRRQKLGKIALDYGLEDAPDLDAYFGMQVKDGRLVVTPKNPGWLPVNSSSLGMLEQQLMVGHSGNLPAPPKLDEEQKRVIILKPHRFYKHLVVELYDAAIAKDGRVKNPLIAVAPLEQLMLTNDPLELKFFTAVSRMQQTIDAKVDQPGLDALKSIAKNPMNLACYIQNNDAGDKISASGLAGVTLRIISKNLQLTVDENGEFYRISGELFVGEEGYPLNELETVFGYFVRLEETLYVVKDLQMMAAVNLFNGNRENLLIHRSQFKEFRKRILNKLEAGMQVNYTFIPEATQKQVEEQQFNQNDRLIYLSDFGQYVMIFPVLRYGEAEIPLRTNEQIYAVDANGGEFLVKRNEPAEREFLELLIKQHPLFEEQLTDQLQYFYLHKKRFLDEDWFLNAFENWRDHKITILGFNELSGNQLNAEKVKITIRVLSGLNWFNTKIEAKFGKRRASLKHLHKAIRNKTKYVQLDDGTRGILPAEWIEKFTKFFEAGEVVDDELRTSKSNYATIGELYEEQMLDETVRLEIEHYRAMLAGFGEIKDVAVPTTLLTTLRPYQHRGLSWLNFLDDLNFGGCLADDMGLGKTIQILAFILSQREKVQHNTNLLVVPTSLIFNWQAEAARFAPSIKIHTIYGADRQRTITGLDEFELIITSYGTLLSDVNFLKDYTFNYIFLDESQNIKNPNSQRFKAVRLLKARNRIAITGTPFENSSFDLYGQLSFACPGLLGSLRYFKEIYAVPIDQFKVSKRAKELQNKIKPFILRRTKQEVAAELPEKTEMLLHCPMEDEQRKLYNAYEREFREFISATTQDQLPKRSMHVLKGLTKLRQICDSPQLLEGVRVPGNASSKIDMLMEQIEGKAANHKILVFSQFVGMLNLIRKELQKRKIGHAYLTGATRNRGEVVNDFQDNPATRVFLISLKAGGTGLNLTAADYVYLVDPWWNPAVENQAIDRVYRIGQQRHVVAVRLICPDTIEEKVIKLQQNKKELAGRLLSAGDVFRSLSKDDLLGLLAGP